jgi:ribonuclease inhibitor
MLGHMREVIVDCSRVGSAEQFWERYIDVAKPEGAPIFGRNLDAFWDAIERGGPGWPGEVSLVFTHSARLSEIQTPSGNASFLDGLKIIAGRASAVKVTFVD